MVKENCGVVGIFSLDGINVIPMLIDSLRALQHRGQEAWGIAVPKRLPLKKLGLVSRLPLNLRKSLKNIHHLLRLVMLDTLLLVKAIWKTLSH